MSDPTGSVEQQLPIYVIEGARSGRSRCKTCRRKIDKGALRLGVLIEGPYGTGHLWHHLKCAARHQYDKVVEAYELEAWKEAKEPPRNVPPLEELAKHRDQVERRGRKRREIPYAEVDPSGRAKCKHCGEPIEKDSVRVVLGRAVYFGSQARISPITVHPGCVAAEMRADDCGTESDGFPDALRTNSPEIPAPQLDALLTQIGQL